MAIRLLERQVRLLEYLTSSAAIFGDERVASFDQALQGIDRGLLRLEASFSHEKRMEKIIAVFPKTFAIAGDTQSAIVRLFIETCPPIGSTRLENASQFYDFLRTRWQREAREPPHLPDVAACELAFAKVALHVQDRGLVPGNREHAPSGSIRRHPGAFLLHCAYDIRPVFEAGSREAAPTKHDTLLAIALPPDAEHPRVFELFPPVFNVLAGIDGWTDRFLLGSAPELDELICDLVKRGLIEVRE